VTGPVARYTSSRWYAFLALFAFACALAAGRMALRSAPDAASAGFVGVTGGIAGIVPFVVFGVFAIVAIGLAALALQPAIEIHETCLVMTGVMTAVMRVGVNGRRVIPWHEIRRVDQGRGQTHGQARWHIPWLNDGNVLVVHVTLDGGSRLWVWHVGGFDSGRSLLRHLRLLAREALLDGIPYRQFWGQGRGEHSRSEQARSERARPEGANPERTNPERVNPERTPLRSRLGDRPFKYPLLLAEDEAEIEHMFQRLKSAGRLDTHGHDIQNHDTPGDASLDSRASGEGQG
jgi:hypothetical protein